jgi:hypothetical protein
LLDFALPATLKDPLNCPTMFGYDPMSKLTTNASALSKVTTLTLKDPLNNTTSFTYDLGDLVRIIDLLNRETTRMLDAAGRLTASSIRSAR